MVLRLRSRVRALWLLPSAPPPSPSPPLDANQLSQPQPHPNMQKYPLATTSSQHLAPSMSSEHAIDLAHLASRQSASSWRPKLPSSSLDAHCPPLEAWYLGCIRIASHAGVYPPPPPPQLPLVVSHTHLSLLPSPPPPFSPHSLPLPRYSCTSKNQPVP